jgi:hypothetical protein
VPILGHTANKPDTAHAGKIEGVGLSAAAGTAQANVTTHVIDEAVLTAASTPLTYSDAKEDGQKVS